MMIAVGMLLVALALDLSFGDPRRGHPVALIGRGMAWCAERLGPPPSRTAGAVLLAAWLLGIGGLAGWIEAMLTQATVWLAIVGGGVVLWPTFAVRTLFQRVHETGELLCADELDAARVHVGRHLVSRDTTDLDRSALSGAAIASLFENLCDSVVAPLFWFAIAGLPGAWAFRVVNTADAMFGYRHGVLERFGTAPARLDDLLNWLPARLAGWLVWLAGHSPDAREGWRRDRHSTPSPNGGWPMAAAAWVLGIRIDKPEVYALNRDGRSPDVRDVSRALARARNALVLFLPLALLLTALRHA